MTYQTISYCLGRGSPEEQNQQVFEFEELDHAVVGAARLRSVGQASRPGANQSGADGVVLRQNFCSGNLRFGPLGIQLIG